MMSSSSEDILCHQQAIAELRKALASARARVVTLEKGIVQQQAAVDAAKAKVTHFTGLIAHMKSKETDLVDLSEFSGARGSLEEAENTRERAVIALCQMKREKEEIEAAIPVLEADKTLHLQELATYGEVRVFPRKQENDN
jgi:multidrug resistance efflux pump